MKIKLREYFNNSEEIEILDDLLSSYSHTKFDRLFHYKSIKALFELFVAENGEEFLSSYSGIQRGRYQDVLQSIMSEFRKYHNQSISFSNQCSYI